MRRAVACDQARVVLFIVAKRISSASVKTHHRIFCSAHNICSRRLRHWSWAITMFGASCAQATLMCQHQACTTLECTIWMWYSGTYICMYTIALEILEICVVQSWQLSFTVMRIYTSRLLFLRDVLRRARNRRRDCFENCTPRTGVGSLLALFS